ncbi:UNVERIFIED_CONTAM: hypothetical protein GTU68_040772 [Idotea baltica]|nr:hypothetical protein [Idotea baltica]
MQGLPNNIIIKKWLPQQDILAHPKVKLFITHGGLLSMQEALFHATPLLALPIFGDQERNAQRINNKGFGTFLFWEDLTSDLLHSTIENLIRNPKYMESVKSVSVSFRDQQNLPLEKAVWWTEYAIRHKGTPQLKSPGASLGWIEYFNIDVIIAIHIAIFVLFKILKMLVKTLLSLCFSKSNPEKKKRA